MYYNRKNKTSYSRICTHPDLMISIVREQMMRSQPRLRKRFRSHQGHTFRVKKLKLKLLRFFQILFRQFSLQSKIRIRIWLNNSDPDGSRIHNPLGFPFNNIFQPSLGRFQNYFSPSSIIYLSRAAKEIQISFYQVWARPYILFSPPFRKVKSQHFVSALC